MQTRLIRIGKHALINPAHVAIVEWQGQTLVLHFALAESTGDSRFGVFVQHTTRYLEGDEAKKCWAALCGEDDVA